MAGGGRETKTTPPPPPPKKKQNQGVTCILTRIVPERMEHVCSNLPIFYTINCIKIVKYTCFKHRLYQSVNRKTHVCNAKSQTRRHVLFTFTRFVATFLQYLPTDLKPINKIFRSLAWVAMTIRLSCKIYKLYE